jgi:prolyl-tRNA synthetase
VHVVGLGKPGSDEQAAAEKVATELDAAGLAVLLDDRDLSPGQKFADAELLGCPVRVTVGRRSLESGALEVQIRRGRESREAPLADGADAIAELWRATD